MIGIRRRIAALAVAVVAAGTVVVVPSPAGAELASVATTSWGVTGLQIGSETDTIDSPVFAMERIGNVLYVGGRFTTVTNGVEQHSQLGLAAFDATTGVWLPEFAPVLDGSVYALQASPDGTRLFVGGDFTTVNGSPDGGLVALDPATGAIDPTWSGRVGGYKVVRSFAIEGSWLYTGGGFTSISSARGGRAAWRVARFDVATGAHDPDWRPVISGGSVWGLDVSPDYGRVYLAGSFTHSNGAVASGGFASVETADGTNTVGVEPLKVNTVRPSGQYTYDVLVANGKVFVAGSQYFLQVLNEADLSLEVYHLSKYRGDYQDLQLVGDRVYAGCHCRQDTRLSSARGVLWSAPPPPGETNAVPFAEVPNSWFAAFDATTGLHLPELRPDINSTGSGIWAIEEGGDGCIWFGGDVTATGGTPQFNITRMCDISAIDTERPTVPGRPTVTATAARSLQLAWNRSMDNFGVVGYRLYDAATNAVLADVPLAEAVLTDLPAGPLSLYARAYDNSGNLSWRSGILTAEVPATDPAPIDTQRPTVPGRPAATFLGAYRATVTWTASTDNVAVAGYRVYDAATNAVLADVPGRVAELTGLAAGPVALYARAYDAAGNESWRSGVTTVEVPVTDPPPPDTVRPSVPGRPNVDGLAPGSVWLSWAPSTDNVAVVGYRLYDAATNAVVADVPDPAAELSGLAAGSLGLYVRAYDAAGNESWRSGIITAEIPAEPPADTPVEPPADTPVDPAP